MILKHTTHTQAQGQMLALGSLSTDEVMRNFYPSASSLQGYEISLNEQGLSEKDKFDFIYDSELLTQIPFDLDRRRFLNSIHGALREGGFLVLRTLVQTKNYDPTESFESVELDENHILWGQTPATDEIPGVVARNGRYYVARKKIAPADTIRAELMRAGFHLLQSEIEIPAGNNPGVLKMILMRKETKKSSYLCLAKK